MNAETAGIVAKTKRKPTAAKLNLFLIYHSKLALTLNRKCQL